MAQRPPQGAYFPQNPGTSNCNCLAANQMTCQQPPPSGCVENGVVYQSGQVAVRNMGNGNMLKCQCVLVRNEATWRCDSHNQRPAGARTPSEAGFQSPKEKMRTCYDGTMPGVPFLPSETWQSKVNHFFRIFSYLYSSAKTKTTNARARISTESCGPSASSETNQKSADHFASTENPKKSKKLAKHGLPTKKTVSVY